jgi:zinc protease
MKSVPRFPGLVAGLILSCATASHQAEPNVAAGEVRTDPRAAKETSDQEFGYFPLPSPLAADPTQLKIPPLDFKVLKPERIKLPNELTLYLVADHAAPLVTLRAMVIAGTVDDPPGKVGRAELTFGMMSAGGTRELDADQLDELLEFHAADAFGGAAEEYAFLQMNVRSQDLQKLFPVWVDILLRPRFQKNRFEISVGRIIESIRRRPDSPDGLAIRALRKAIYGPDSVFARETTEKTLKSLSVVDLKDFHKRVVVPRATSLIITGDFDRQEILDLVNRHLGSWNGGEKVARNYPPAPLLRGRVIFVPKETAQSKIRIGGYGYVRLSPQEYAIRVMNTALGGGLGVARLFRDVREQGLAYSAHSAALPGPVGGLFYAAADTKPESTVETTEAVLRVLRDVRGNKSLTTSELAVAADMYLNSFAFRFDSPEKVGLEKAIYDLFGYADDYLDTYRQKIADVNPDSALEAAKTLIQLDAFQIVIVGSKDKVGDLSRFGPVTVIKDVESFQ